MTLWNGLQKLPIVIFGKQKKKHFELRYQKCSGDRLQNKNF